MSSEFTPRMVSVRDAYRMAGGAPAGMKIVPGEEGCTTMSINIRIITIHGNRSTKPKGIDIFELPFSRIRRLKKADLEGR